jgi:putative transposase
VFFEQGDYALYRDLLAERCRKVSVACRGYGLMPNQVHLILVPATADANRPTAAVAAWRW